MNYNHLTLGGNLTRNCEVRYTAGGKAVCKFGLAVNERWKGTDGQDRESVLFVDVTIFDKRGEAFAKFHKKGDQAFVVGKLQLEQWEDRDSGAKRSKLSMIAHEWQFVGAKKDRAEPTAAPSEPDESKWPTQTASINGGADDTPF